MSPGIEVACYKGRKAGFSWGKLILGFILAGAAVFAALLGYVLGGAHDHVTGDPQVMIVLGCQVKPYGPSVLLRDRLDKALDYWKEHREMIIVVSGGQGPDEPSTEARAMADYLAARGVPEDQILLEEESHNSILNLKKSKEVLERAGFSVENGVLVVSNGFHLSRVRMLARRAGYGDVSTLAAPASHLPLRLKMYIREPAALVKSFVLDR